MLEFMIPMTKGGGQTLVNSVHPKSSKQMMPFNGCGEQNYVNSVLPDSKQLIKPLKDGVEQMQKNSLHTKSTLQLQEFKIPGQILTDQSKVKARDNQFPPGFKIGDGNAWPESGKHLNAQVQIDTVAETKPKTVETFQTETQAAAGDASNLPQLKLQHQQKAKPLPPRLPISNRTQATNQRSNEETKDASEKYPEENQLNTSNSTKPNQSLRQGQRQTFKSQKSVKKQDGDESDQSCYNSDIDDNDVEVNEDDIFDEAFKKSIKDLEGQPLKVNRCRLQKLQEHIETAKTAALLLSMQPNLNMTHSEKANQIYLIEQQLKKLNSVRKKLVGNLVKLRGDEIYSPNDGQFTSVTDLMRKQLKNRDSVFYSSSDIDELEPQKIHDYFLMESFSFTDVQNVDLDMYRDLLKQCDIPVVSVTRDKVKLTTILNRFVHVKVKSLNLKRDYLESLHKFLELIYAQYSKEMHSAVKSANNHVEDEEKEVRKTKNHFLGLQSVTFFQRVLGFLWSENLQVIASSLLPDKQSNFFSTVNVQKLGRTKTTLFTTAVDVEGNVLTKTSYINETMGFFSNSSRFVGMNLEKFVCCKNEAMQKVILKGKKSGIMKIAFTLNFQTSEEGINLIKSAKNRQSLRNQLNMELTTIYRNLVRNDCLFTLPYDRLFATFFDSNFSQHPAFFVNAGNLAGIFYCFDEDRTGFIGKLVEVGTDFLHEEMQTRYAPDNRRNYLYDPSEDCLKLFQTDIIERAKFIVPLENKLNVVQKPTLMELLPNYIHVHLKKGIVYPDLKPMIGPKSQSTIQKRLKEQEKRKPVNQRDEELYDRGEVFWFCSFCKAIKNTADYNRHNCKKRLNDPVPAVELTRYYPCPFPQCISKQSPRAMNLHVFNEHLDFYKKMLQSDVTE